jgi:hypothetical protein
LAVSAPFGTGNPARIGFRASEAASRDEADGTSVMAVLGWSSRRPSYDTNMKVRSRLSGAPNTPPKSCWCSLGFWRCWRLTKSSAESSASFRKYSESEPWNWFVPDRVTIEIWPPGIPPNSGA